jgi:signal transduction histidine kinase
MRLSAVAWMVLSGGALIVLFVGSTLYVDHRTRSIDERVDDILTNATPSIEELAAARTELRHLEMGVGRYLGAHLRGKPFDRAVLEGWRRAAERHFAAYERWPSFSSERAAYARVIGRKVRLYAVVERTLDAIDADDVEGARALMFGELAEEAEALDHGMERLLSANNDFAERSAEEIRTIRRKTTVTALLLDGLASLFGGLLVIFGIRAALQYRRSVEERKRMTEERLRELDAFAVRIAHDLRGPLTSLILSAGLAQSKPARMPEAMDRIKRGVGMMNEMIEALLAFARAAAPAAAGVAVVERVIEDVVAEALSDVERAQATLRVELPPGPAAVACAPGVLASVLSNLLHNAAKFIVDAPGDRRIFVRCRAADPMVRLEVEDTGPGVAPGEEARIFQAFARAGGSRGKPGLGLGLATVKRLVEAHGGEVGVKAGPGGGACFWVDLPSAQRA